MTIPAWYEGLDPVTVDIDLRPDAGVRHRITWRDGELVLDDHPDVEADVALGALGGGRCRCIDVLKMWNAQLTAPEVLTVGRRWRERVWAEPTTVVRVERSARLWRSQWEAIDDPGIDLDALDARLARRVAFVWLLGRDERLHDRLQLTVLDHAERRWSSPMFRDRYRATLAAALAGRAFPALREAGHEIPLERIELLPPGAEPAVGHEAAALPLSWLTNVWGRGVAVHEGRFITAVTAIVVGDDGGKVLVARGVDRQDWRIPCP